MAFRGPRDESLDDYVSARVAAIRVGEFINAVMGALTKRQDRAGTRRR